MGNTNATEGLPSDQVVVDPRDSARRATAPSDMPPEVISADVTQQRPMKAETFLDRKTIEIEGISAARLRFRYENNIESKFTITWFAKDKSISGCRPSITPTLQPSEIRHFPAGKAEFVSQETVNLEQCGAARLAHEPTSKYYPLIISMTPYTNGLPEIFTFCALRVSPRGVTVEVIKQKLSVGDQVYSIFSIYGVDENEEKECIVCLSDPKDTAAMPCGHLVYCNSCAQSVRMLRQQKCPVCRAQVTNLVRLGPMED